MSTEPWQCPECGNRDRKLIDTNGLPENHWDLTLLCMAPAEDPSQGLLLNPDHVLEGEDARLVCGYQWCPNA